MPEIKTIVFEDESDFAANGKFMKWCLENRNVILVSVLVEYIVLDHYKYTITARYYEIQKG